MRVLHIVPTVARESGGPARSTQGLVAALRQNGVEAWLLSMTPGEEPWLSGFDASAFLSVDSRGYFAWKRVVRKAIEKLRPDLLHLHQIWTLDLHAAAVVAREMKIPYVLAPRGSLEPWALAQKALKKKIAMALYQRYDLNHAVALHATAEAEAKQFEALGLRAPIFLSVNAVNVPEYLPDWNQHADGKRRVLFLSRVHYKKGLLELVQAWGLARPRGWKVEIVGFDSDGYLEKCLNVARQLGVEEDFIYTGSLQDEAKWSAYRRADLFVLPSYSENFGIVVAEALYAGLPVITTKGTPWREIDGTCGWWVDLGIEPLAKAIRHAVDLSDAERCAMGAVGRKMIEANFMWKPVVMKLRDAYQKLLEHDGSFRNFQNC